MGLCFNKPMDAPKQTERQLTRELRRDRHIDNLTKKLLILGPKRSGKSTIFNQLKYIHGNGFDDKQRTEAKQSIIIFMIQSMQNIIECLEEYEKYKRFPIHKFSLNEEAKSSAHFIKSLSVKPSDHDSDHESNLNQLILKHFQILVKQKAIKSILSNPCKYYIDYSIIYFLDHLERICDNNYTPSDQDIINLRIKRDGFNETKIEMGNDKFIVYDANYKTDICKTNKYIHCFTNITAIIFVASLSCFDERIFENDQTYREKLEWKRSLTPMASIVGGDILDTVLSFVGYPKNAMHDALDTFDQLCNNKWFADIPILLFMNKSDLFRDKMDQIANEDQGNNKEMNSFNVCFPEYKKECNFKKCSSYIMKQFEKRDRSKKRKRVYKHIVNGTDSTIMRMIFYDVQNIVINASLDHAGLL